MDMAGCQSCCMYFCIIITLLLCSSNENLLNFTVKTGLCVKTKNYYWQQMNQRI